MPTSLDGTRAHLDYWLYGIVETASQLGNAGLFLRATQEASIRKFLKEERLVFGDAKEPSQILRQYNERLDQRGVLNADDIQYREASDGLRLSVRTTCPYRSACNWIHDDGGTVACFRAIAMSEVLRLATRRSYEGILHSFGAPCQLSFKDDRLGAARDGD
jgi:hypothetical protein